MPGTYTPGDPHTGPSDSVTSGIRLCRREISREGSRAFHCKAKEGGEKGHIKVTLHLVFSPQAVDRGKQYHLVKAAKDFVTAWSGAGGRTQHGGKLCQGRWQQGGITPGQVSTWRGGHLSSRGFVSGPENSTGTVLSCRGTSRKVAPPLPIALPMAVGTRVYES